MFSSHTGAPTDGPLLDTDPALYSIQKSQKGPFDIMNTVSVNQAQVTMTTMPREN